MFDFVIWLVSASIYVCDFFFFFKQKTAYEMRISDWSSDVCSSDLVVRRRDRPPGRRRHQADADRTAVRPDQTGREPPQAGPGDEPGHTGAAGQADRKSVVEGKSVSVRVDLGGRRILKKTNSTHRHYCTLMSRNYPNIHQHIT